MIFQNTRRSTNLTTRSTSCCTSGRRLLHRCGSIDDIDGDLNPDLCGDSPFGEVLLSVS
ncbi:hypothetical protein RSSM_01383 [Rhodopirellula sallentina SM41]|uniref:Uncharacterized protein n=1 Tax=Rhodopirellula sallentina SM41 TaxID=1263870 RepID=M5U6U7_9BACT|nr:hypothetical protein RSSM_01383 [Rhodopirellula sallentina SM41]